MTRIKALVRHALVAHPANWRVLGCISRGFFATRPSGAPRFDSYPTPTANPHVAEALAWLKRAQDVTADRGISAYYTALYNPLRPRTHGWAPSYPETTGYIIGPFFDYYHQTADPELFDRALEMADWECQIQLSTGAVQADVVGAEPQPAIFNTGQVLLGLAQACELSADRD